MERELLEDLSSVLRAYNCFKRAKTEEGKKIRFENLKNISRSFEEKWNQKTKKNFTITEWIRLVGKEKKDEQIYKGISR